MHEVPRLIPTIRETFTNGPHKIFVSVSLIGLDLNRVARTSRVFKTGIGCELVISVNSVFLLKTNTEFFKNYLTKNSTIVLVSNKISYLPARLYISKLQDGSDMEMILKTYDQQQRTVLLCVQCQRLPVEFKLSKLP